ncbi:IclR family transcriptional regulator [Hydrogenophaga sp.]|uniref:IclR family transcriptional regulator n=1 Tax=Hydrogenophaga sp. TaxID=1904254 RepID=UPI00271670F4|nr:IclR family transcriptional regulator [Hydrogenophaga sp.]MDO9437633.1 IclR family transcriptional regulator [Hydrogenophaga sp.]
MAVSRALQILGLFTVEQPVLSVEWLVEHLRASRASVYRDIQALVHAGLLEKMDMRGYALGARIVELDRQIRLGDPLLHAAGALPQQLSRESGGTVLLCRLHARTVLCILEVTGSAPGLSVSYERGRAMPLYRGATSRILLAHLPPARLRQLLDVDAEAMRSARLPLSLSELQDALAPLRAQGHVITHGEVDTNAVGVAVPLLDNNRLLGSLSVVLPAPGFTPLTEQRALSLLKSCARRIEARLENDRRRDQAHRHTHAPLP